MEERVVTIQSQEETNNEEWDRVSVKEMYDFLDKVNEFYARRGNPRINAIWLADTIMKRLKNDLDYYVNCEGQKGYGKSNLMLLMALLQSRYSGLWKNKLTGKIVRVVPRTTPLPPEWEHIEVGFRFKKNMSFLDNTADIKIKFNSLDKYMPFVIDEGSKNLHKYNWQSKTQFMLVKLSDTERYQNKAFYVCFPHFTELNAAFRNDRIMMRLYVYARNVKQHYASCIISLKDVNRYVVDPWHTDDNARAFEYQLRKRPAALRTPTDILNAEKKLSGYAGNFDIPELKVIAPKIWAHYMRYKITNAQKELNDDEDNEFSKNLVKWKMASKNLIDYLKNLHPELTNAEVARIMGLSTTTLSDLRKLEAPPDDRYRMAGRLVEADNNQTQDAKLDKMVNRYATSKT
jgi:hypothetical protein